jgi:drug/metabolite transporter, DME family
MRPEIYALLSAVGWAGDSILVRLGARASNVAAAALLSFALTAATLWCYIALAVPFRLLWSPAILYFIVSGFLQPLLARTLYYTGITRLGVARAGPLLGTVPLIAIAVAVVFLGERPGVSVYLGTALIVASVWLVSARRSGETDWRALDLIYPFGAAFFAAVSQNLRKAGLLILPDPFVGSAVGTSTSLVLYMIFLLSSKKMALVKIHRASLPFFSASAFLSMAAQLLTFIALSRGEVSVIIPIVNVIPLFAVLFSALFLRELEKVTPKVILGAVLMVSGVFIISNR